MEENKHTIREVRNMGNGEFSKRKQYLIASKFQLKYTALVVVFMFLIAWLAGYTIYYTVFGLLGEKLANVYPQGRLALIFKTVNIVLLIRVALLIPFVVMISIILSHRIAGPVYRMERYINEVSSGDLSSILKLRKRDEFKSLAEAINKMTQGFAKLTKDNKDSIIKLSSLLDDLNETVSHPKFNKDKAISLVKEADRKANELKRRFSQYRVGEEA
ncbi:MAG: hypothetical protein COS99_02270 [Candidatus Omnitrophica bacterium CG07_land_8_20_14_0_80_42_15]|uniref:HAMP domain-containing protein n=1 Tax=Candidatus Aquitaenariimonas noxiae TaxID=1974741 RepID=A0A2J0KXK3_9BACT|nr:MAG: hypothetical protein COS99_02270 [Candidatus Omnitrophica bacterium CG07_land_8_20_14_0_80_42_15]